MTSPDRMTPEERDQADIALRKAYLKKLIEEIKHAKGSTPKSPPPTAPDRRPGRKHPE
jgi:hypothetical protein